MTVIGVLGAYGGVGSAAVRQLRAWGLGPLRLGSRNPRGAAVAVDLNHPVELDSFCRGCRVVLNCAGPSLRTGDRVARAALRAGADYVDAGGDEPLHALLSHPAAVPAGRTALLSAGMQPGLSSLLVRGLASELERPRALVGYAGGLGRFTPGAAEDYVASVGGAAGTPLAAWRDGRTVPAALEPLLDVELEWFPGRVSAHPYVSTELERVASALELAEASWYTVFDGEQVRRALERRPALDAGPEALAQAARRLSAAAELDRFGREPYQLFALALEAELGDGLALQLRGSDPIELTGAAAALAAAAVLEGWCGAGLGFAGELIDPRLGLDRLSSCEAVTALERSPLDALSRVEEGVV